jgi:WD repeat-containing protein 24
MLWSACHFSDLEVISWDLKMGQRGQLDRLPVAHAGPILALNWFIGSSDREKLPSVSTEGWVATGGLDRCVKVHLLCPPFCPF